MLLMNEYFYSCSPVLDVSVLQQMAAYSQPSLGERMTFHNHFPFKCVYLEVVLFKTIAMIF